MLTDRLCFFLRLDVELKVILLFCYFVMIIVAIVAAMITKTDGAARANAILSKALLSSPWRRRARRKYCCGVAWRVVNLR